MSVHLFVFGSYIERWRGDSFSGATFDDGSEPSLQYAGCAAAGRDRKSTRLNSSHSQISYAVFCLKKKNQFQLTRLTPMSKSMCLRCQPPARHILGLSLATRNSDESCGRRQPVSAALRRRV